MLNHLDPSLVRNRKAMTGIVILLTVLIALADWLIFPNISLGLLYLFPTLLAAGILNRWGIAVFALTCAILRENFNPFPWDVNALPRFVNAMLAYLGAGLFASELIRNRRHALMHVSELEEQVRLRQTAEQQLRSLIDGSPAAILTTGADGRVLLANEAAHQVFGCETGSLPGQPIDDYLPVLASLRQTTRVRHLVHTGMESPGYRRGRESFLAHVWMSSYETPSGKGLALVVFDASEQLRSREQEIYHTVATSVRVGLGAYWHEMRNLCGAMTMVAGSLERNPSVAGTGEMAALKALLGSASHLAREELQAGTGQFTSVADVRQVLEQLRVVVEPSFQACGAIVRWPPAGELPMVCALPGGLMQIFLNLANNACDSLERSGRKEFTVTAGIEERRVVVRFFSTAPVSDPGALFQPFQKAAAGAGLGLYISRALARSFGGNLCYEPAPGGACFTVTLQPEGD